MDTNPFQIGDKVICITRPSETVRSMVLAYEEQAIMTITCISDKSCFCVCEHFKSSFVYRHKHLIPASQSQMKQLMAKGQITAQQFFDYSEKLNRKEA